MCQCVYSLVVLAWVLAWEFFRIDLHIKFWPRCEHRVCQGYQMDDYSKMFSGIMCHLTCSLITFWWKDQTSSFFFFIDWKACLFESCITISTVTNVGKNTVNWKLGCDGMDFFRWRWKSNVSSWFGGLLQY